MLKKTPLTFLPSSDPSGLTAVQDTLIVTVNGVGWTEMPSLLSSGPDATVFLARTDDQQRTTVSFGDGRNGAMPPSGVGNIRARYRRGLGSSGNLPNGAVRQMIDSAPGLQRVTNPLPTTGGADPSGIDQIRQTTPASLRSFARAVSADDYAVLALQFPGIAKATSNWVVRGQDGKPVPIPYMQLTVALNDGTPVAGSVTANNLRAFIDSHRDTNVPLRILDFTPVFIDVELTVDILDQYPRQATLTRVTAALNPGINPDG
jgi:predicted phage baseplate assembly protein